MFATSYVEEEQHFWYWTTTAWIAVIAFRRLSHTKQPIRAATSAVILLALHRLSIRWNQTGQKHAGAPDISRSVFPQHHIILWTLVLATYGNIFLKLTKRTLAGIVPIDFAAVIAAIVVVPAFVFKLNFAQADTPELVKGLGESIRTWTSQWDLVLQARVVFTALAVLALLSVFHSASLWAYGEPAKSTEKGKDFSRPDSLDILTWMRQHLRDPDWLNDSSMSSLSSSSRSPESITFRYSSSSISNYTVFLP